MNHSIVRLLAGLACLGQAASAPLDDAPGDTSAPLPGTPGETGLVPEKGTLESAYDLLVARRLSLGAQTSRFSLRETERPADPNQELTYLGHINRLEAEQDSAPHLVAGYELCPYLSVEYTDDRVAARAYNYDVDGVAGPTDGTVVLSGPIFSVQARLPLYDTVFPFVGYGYAPWSASFEYAPWWHLGWPSPEAYAEAGSPGTRVGHQRIMELDDDTANVLTAGVAVKLHRHAELDFCMRRMDLTAPARFYTQIGQTRTLLRSGEFPMDHTSYSVALKAVF